MATKIVNGQTVAMTAQEEADFEASRVPTVEAERESLKQAVAGFWAGSISNRKMMDVADPAARRTAKENKARGLAIAIDNAPNLQALRALNIASGWD
jgi:hypothetical protein